MLWNKEIGCAGTSERSSSMMGDGNAKQEKLKYDDSQALEGQSEQDIDALVALLDGYTEAGDSRIKVDVVEGEGKVIARQYHHGRCDVGSPWACGTAFDVLE